VMIIVSFLGSGSSDLDEQEGSGGFSTAPLPGDISISPRPFPTSKEMDLHRHHLDGGMRTESLSLNERNGTTASAVIM